jgi:ABC-type dipeptide/oligopeptide/nickel transport system permease component
MSAFIVRRLLLAIPTLLGVLVVAFLLLYVAPGDPVMAMVGERADEETIARLRTELRLDDPLPVQFGHYIAGIAKGDLGRSYITNRPIRKDILERFPKTLQLAGAAMLLATICGVTLGVLSARKPGGVIDRFGLGLAYLGISFPVYWVGLLLILLFAVTLHWLPPSGFGGARYLVLPALALGMRSIAFLARMTRSAMLDSLGADYVRTARAKGLRESTVVARHALRNALIPIITVLGLDFGAYLTGSILTETIFSWPGVGKWLIEAINRRDYPVLQGGMLLLGVVVMLVNLLVDVAYGVINPRIRASH